MLLGVFGTILSVVQSRMLEDSINLWVIGVSGIISLLAFVGFILFLVAMYGFSKDYAERKIFSYILYGLIISVVIAVIIGIIWFALTMVSIFSLVSSSGLSPSPSTPQIQSLIAPYYAPLITAMTVVSLVWILFNYKAFNLLAEKSGVHMFRTAAKIFVAGAVVNVAVGALFAVLGLLGLIDYYTMLLVSVPGGLVQYVAWGFAAKSFFSIPIPTPSYAATVTSPAQGPYCPHCGAQNQVDAIYCSRCGQKLGA
jgi:uncharacterized membrane protein